MTSIAQVQPRSDIFTACADPGDMAALLKFKAAFDNFDTAVRRRTARWDPGLPMCSSWQGVTCWPDGYVRTIDLSIPERASPALVPLTAPFDNTSFAHASVPHQLAGESPAKPCRLWRPFMYLSAIRQPFKYSKNAWTHLIT